MVPQATPKRERLIDVIGRAGIELPHVCYHPQLGSIQTCDTCLVEINGKLVRACATSVMHDMSVQTTTERAQSARTAAFDRILSNHLLYCTVCDNNNGNCTVHNTTKMLGIEQQSSPFKTKPTKSITLTSSTAMIPTSVFYAAAASRPARISKSTRRYQSPGRIPIREFCGMVAQRSANRAAFRAATA